MARDTLHQTAIAFLLAHQGQHLSCDRQLLVDRCIEHIRVTGPAERTAAAVITLQALGDIQSRGNGAAVDLNTTTSYAVFITDPATGKRACFTATDLLRLSRDHAFHASLRARTTH